MEGVIFCLRMEPICGSAILIDLHSTEPQRPQRPHSLHLLDLLVSHGLLQRHLVLLVSFGLLHRHLVLHGNLVDKSY